MYEVQTTYECLLFISGVKALVVMDFEKHEQRNHTVIQEAIVFLSSQYI